MVPRAVAPLPERELAVPVPCPAWGLGEGSAGHCLTPPLVPNVLPQKVECTPRGAWPLGQAWLGRLFHGGLLNVASCLLDLPSFLWGSRGRASAPSSPLWGRDSFLTLVREGREGSPPGDAAQKLLPLFLGPLVSDGARNRRSLEGLKGLRRQCCVSLNKSFNLSEPH